MTLLGLSIDRNQAEVNQKLNQFRNGLSPLWYISLEAKHPRIKLELFKMNGVYVQA